jgi:P27 family predicted phage terminase small subunit
VVNKAQKPVSQLQNPRGGRAERRTLTVVESGPLEIPAAPEGLKAAGRAVWEAYWGDRVSLAATVVDGPEIARYCMLHDERAAVEKRIKGRSQYGGDVIEGMNGPILNPLHRVRKELTREIEKLREQLGILPLARMRLGLVTVQAEHGRRSLPPAKPKAQPAVIDIDEVV